MSKAKLYHLTILPAPEIPPTVRTEGFADLMGDITLTCAGGTPTLAGSLSRNSTSASSWVPALDVNGNIAWDPGTDTAGGFGQVGHLLVVGRWD